MSSSLASLRSLELYFCAAIGALARELPESLGAEFRTHQALLGKSGMVGVVHQMTGLELVAVPGGTFEMGLSDADIAESPAFHRRR